MNKITLATTYYQNPQNLYEFWNQHYDHVDELIVVDDGSCVHALREQHIYDPQQKCKLFEVTKDLGFNSHGCRNLIMKQSSHDWVMLMDIDRLIINACDVFSSLRNRKLKLNCRYKFVGHFERLGAQIHESVNDYLIHKSYFWQAGGYDEELQGYRDGDRSFFRQLAHFGHEQVLNEVNVILTRTSSLKLSDSLARSKNDVTKLPAQTILIVKKREQQPDPNKPILNFDWRDITTNNQKFDEHLSWQGKDDSCKI